MSTTTPETAPSDPTTSGILPIATGQQTRRYVIDLFRHFRRFLTLVLGVQILASAAGLVGPLVLENVIDNTTKHGGARRIDEAIVIFAVALVIQTIFTGVSRCMGAILGEGILARPREQLI